MHIATWNVNSLRVRLEHLTQWLNQAQPDVVGLQETKLIDSDFPRAVLEESGYRVVYSGQKTYNGVALLSRQPIEDVVTALTDFPDEQRRVLAATIDGVRVWNLYVPNGQAVDSDKYRYKLDWLGALHRHLAEEIRRYPELVLIGDFNIAPTDADIHDPAAWAGQVLASEPERAALKQLLDLGLHDVFRRFTEHETQFSWWDYRAAAFRRGHGLRIDLILATEALAKRCTSCRIDVEPRRWERPSDHTPVSACFAGRS